MGSGKIKAALSILHVEELVSRAIWMKGWMDSLGRSKTPGQPSQNLEVNRKDQAEIRRKFVQKWAALGIEGRSCPDGNTTLLSSEY